MITISPSKAMQQIHDNMHRRYVENSVTQQEIENAKYLETFFLYLKNKQLTTNTSGIDTTMFDQVLNTIQTFNPRLNINQLFRHFGGKRFERELAIVENALANVVGEMNMSNSNIKSFMTGSEVTRAIEILPQEIAPELLKKIGIKIVNTTKDFTIPGYYVPGGKQVKIDNIGLATVTLRSNATPEMIRIFNIMKDATFTAKNYGSTSNKFIQAFENLTLGHSNIGPILLNILPQVVGSTWPDYITTIALNQNDPSVILHVQHLRQIYELTGLGQQGKNIISQQHGGAKYLVYNDPSSDTIRVRATAEIVSSILKNNKVRHNPFDSYTTEITRDLLSIGATYDKSRI